jgi:cytochrome o ubiquinol oxidase subunit 2
MHFEVHAVPAGQFTAWIESTRNSGPTLDAATYTTLARQSLNVVPFTYRETAPELFQQIATQVLPPGPGPRTDQPNQTVSPRTEP